MEKFLNDINYMIFSYYIKNQFPNHSSFIQDDNCIFIKNDDYHMSVYLWKNKVIELKMMNEGMLIYYLHFEFINFKKSLQLFNEFINYAFELTRQRNYKVLICCSGGLTSSYFAEGMKELIKQIDENIDIEAMSYTKINQVKKDFDLILLAPQLSYLYYQYVSDIHIEMIPTSMYATYNYKEVYKFINKRRMNEI